MSDWSEVTLERTPAFKRARQTPTEEQTAEQQPTEEQTTEEQTTEDPTSCAAAAGDVPMTLASYKGRQLCKSELTFRHIMPVGDNNKVLDLLTGGGKRGPGWKVLVIKYEEAGDDPWRGTQCEMKAKKLHESLHEKLSGIVYFMTFSSTRKHVYVLARAVDVAMATRICRTGEEFHTKNRLQGQYLFELVDAMTADACMAFSNVLLVEPKMNEDKALMWDETRAIVDTMSMSTVRDATADAKHARKYGKPTALQVSLLLFKEDIATFLRDKATVISMTVEIASVLTRYPRDFNPSLCDLKGWEFDHVTNKFRDLTLHEYYTRKYMDKAAIFIGSSGAGKTALCHALAKDFTIGKGKTIFISSKALDPLGLVTKNGDMTKVGAFVFNDTPLRTLMNEIMSTEATKALMDVREPCAYTARYHDAILPRLHARLFSCNSGLHPDGTVDNGHYFCTNRQPALASMARRDLSSILSMTDDDHALCRRVVMFTPTARDIGLQTEGLIADAAAAYEQELEIRSRYYASAP
jgi:hypothetical protein